MDREYLSGDLRRRMQDLLKERKITQAEIAAQMDMSEAALSRFFSKDTDKLSSEAVRKAALYLNVSTDFLMGLSDFPERHNYDISELGLSHKAALAMYTGAVNTDVVNRMLENRQFMELTKKIGQYFDDTESAGFAAMNAMLATLAGHAQQQNVPDAARQMQGMTVDYKETEIQTILREFETMLREIRDGISTHTPTTEALTAQTVKTMLAETEKNGAPPSLTPDAIRQLVMAKSEAMNAVSPGLGTQLGEMLLQFADSVKDTALQHGLLPDNDEESDQ